MRSVVAMNAFRQFALCSALLACSCAPRTTGELRFVIVLHAWTSTHEAVADVRFWADGRELGTTDLHGDLRAALTGRDREVVSLSAACPPAYRTLVPSRRLLLHRIEGRAQKEPDFELDAHCEPLEHRAALVVRVRGPNAAGLPIRVGSETIGQTELDGTAHLLLSARPHSTLRVELATDAYPNLVPHDPVHSFQLEDENNIFLVDQRFSERARKPALPARQRAAPSPAPRPYRIGSR
jgi:hypothetical protein